MNSEVVCLPRYFLLPGAPFDTCQTLMVLSLLDEVNHVPSEGQACPLDCSRRPTSRPSYRVAPFADQRREAPRGGLRADPVGPPR
jgi:hypothetical protein